MGNGLEKKGNGPFTVVTADLCSQSPHSRMVNGTHQRSKICGDRDLQR